VDCIFLAWHSDQRFVVVNSVLEYSCVISNKESLDKTERLSFYLGELKSLQLDIHSSTFIQEGPVITVPVCHMKLLGRLDRSTKRVRPFAYGKAPPDTLGILEPEWHATGFGTPNFKAPTLFSVWFKLTQLNRAMLYKNPVFNQVSFATLYINIQYISLPYVWIKPTL